MTVLVLCFISCVITVYYQLKDSPESLKDDNERLLTLLAKCYNDTIKNTPEIATYVGNTSYNTQLTDLSDEAFENALDRLEYYERKFGIIRYNKLTNQNKTAYESLNWTLAHARTKYDLDAYMAPLSDFYGLQIEFFQVIQNTPFYTLEDHQNYAERLHALPTQISQIQGILNDGLERGFTRPQTVLAQIPSQLALLSNVTVVSYHPYMVPFTMAELLGLSASFDQAEWQNVIADAGSVIATSVAPAWTSFYSYFNKTYYPKATSNIAASALPNGARYYQWSVEFATTQYEYDYNDFYTLGFSEVASVRAQMIASISSLPYPYNNMSISELFDSLRTSPSQYSLTESEYLAALKAITKTIDPLLPLLFRTLPWCTYGISAVPAIVASLASPIRYVSPDFLCNRAGFLYVNSYRLTDIPKFMMVALALGNTVPGRHFQLALQTESTNYDYLKLQQYPAFVEGWSLYAESLGTFGGVYEADPLSYFGYLTHQMLCACRLVIDPAIHAMGWTKAEAVEFLTQYVPLSANNIEEEVDRIIAYPGQGLACKAGERKFNALQAAVRSYMKQKNEVFDLRTFHDVLLNNGSMPINQLDKHLCYAGLLDCDTTVSIM